MEDCCIVCKNNEHFIAWFSVIILQFNIQFLIFSHDFIAKKRYIGYLTISMWKLKKQILRWWKCHANALWRLTTPPLTEHLWNATKITWWHDVTSQTDSKKSEIIVMWCWSGINDFLNIDSWKVRRIRFMLTIACMAWSRMKKKFSELANKLPNLLWERVYVEYITRRNK